MNNGITVSILGDSAPFSKAGKSIGYLITIGQSNYIVDCGAHLFQQIGGVGLKAFKGLVITHCHDDHKRWFTDLAIFYRYAPDITDKIPLLASEEVGRELWRMSEPALDRTLSNDSKQIIDIPYDKYINYMMLGPRAKYRILSRDEGDGRFRLCVIDNNNNLLGPEKAKIVVSRKTGRPRMLFRDPQYNEWIEPESFYPFSSDIFYEKDKNTFHDDEENFSIEAVQAPVWHGIPNIGVKFKTENETLIFSSDTYHNRKVWKELCDTKRAQRLNMSRKKFESASVLHGDINDFIERTWSKERYEDALLAFDDSVVIHDVSVRDSTVHTSYNMLGNTSLKKEKTILTHSPDRISSEWVLCCTDKIFRIVNNEYFELVGDDLYPMNADIYHKENGKYYVGYKNDDGLYSVYRKDGMHYICSEREGWEGERIYRVDLYEDISGRYYPTLLEENEFYIKRHDGQVEKVERTDSGSIGRVVEDCRKKILNSRAEKTAVKLQSI
jgi:hypothetical protein